ncbi:efflux RND transporter permease subunit [Adhaeretor mobilis]|uniref:Multidrug resistance protein MdtB n=1 Tax=Adhaeretor mobilis TaxID=1930276 RepID=A0A517N2W5_9BACT|nr:efflux RND transporter permease subunit [Adhaeretor mobilis]QDT01480.1 Multidrug resistance protein MdtB [Adhaeretor mobilis]
MQWLAKVCVERPIFALMLILAIVVAGVTSYDNLGIDRFPNIDLPTIRVQTIYPGAASVEVESEVSQPLEDAVATVAGLDELRSISSDGVSMLLLTFRLDQNINVAAQDVRDAIAAIMNRLPPDIDPPVVQKQDLDASPILSIAVSGPRDTRELYFMADRYVKGSIESARGVGQVLIEGAVERAIQINIQADKLAAYRLSIMQVHDAIVAQNAEVPGGRVDAGYRELSLRTLGRMPESRNFNDLVVSTVDNVPVRIRDLGESVDLTKERRTLARFNGDPAVVLLVQRQSGMNTVEVIDAVKERLATARGLLPSDVKAEILQDQSRYIRAALHEIQNHLVSGSLMASVIVLLFMRSWRSTVIAAIAIPTSIIGAFAVMKVMGFTMNNVTMLALVLMVGVVIDDAIIVLENVFRAIEEKGLLPKDAAIQGTREIGSAVLATTLSLVIVFLPVSFLSSVTGRLLYEFGITASVAVLISMIVSFSLTPMMCSRMLGKNKVEQSATTTRPASRGGFYRVIESTYMFLLRHSLRLRWLVILLVVLTIAANVPLYHMVKQDYIPTDVDEAEFEARIYAPEGVSVTSMEDIIHRVEPKVLDIVGVTNVMTTVGGGSGIRGPSSASMYVRLEDIETRSFSWNRLANAILAGDPAQAWQGNFSQREKMREIRQIIAQYPELRASVRNLTSFRQGAPVDIDFVVTGPSLQFLADFSARLAKEIADIPGIVDIDTTLRMDKPNLLAHIDRERAAVLGIDVQEVADTLRVAVGGDDTVSRFYDSQDDDAYDVELRLVGVDRGDIQDISQLYLRAMSPASSSLPPMSLAAQPLISGIGYDNRSNPLTRIDNVVTFEETHSPARIDRLDRQRMAAIRANLGSGYALADRVALVQDAAEKLGLPPGYSTRVMGRARELEKTLQEFLWTCALSFVCMYIVLAAQYEHLFHPITILLSLPIAVPFGLLSLWMGGETLNLYSALGILVLFGMVKKASILQVDHINQLRAGGMEREQAILVGNRDRLRPILMTVISFIAGMIPLLIATGPGAEERRSIAVLVVGGMSFSLLLTLLAVPVIYSVLDDISAAIRKRVAAS